MTEQFANNAQGVLSAPITAAQTSISITPTDYTGRPAASNFPTQGNFRIVVQSFDVTTQIPTSAPEIMIVTAVAGNTFTVERGAENSKAIAFASGAQVTNVITAGVMEELSMGGAVSSVFGRTGAVTAQAGDYAAFYVPYTGATGNVNLGTYYIETGSYIANGSATTVIDDIGNIYYANGNTLASFNALHYPDGTLLADDLENLYFGNALYGGNSNGYTGAQGFFSVDPAGSGGAYGLATIGDYNGSVNDTYIAVDDGTSTIVLNANSGVKVNGNLFIDNSVAIDGNGQFYYSPDAGGSVFTDYNGDVYYVTGATLADNSGNLYTPAALIDSTGHAGSMGTILGSVIGGNTVWQSPGNLGLITNPMTTSGDTLYGAASGTPTRLAGNTTATKKFLTQTGTGSASAAPGWNTIVTGDLPTVIPNAATANLTSQSAAVSSVVTVTTTALSTYTVSGYLTATAATVDVVALQVSYFDENNTSRTQTVATMPSAITGAFSGVAVIRVKSGTTATAKTVLTTGGGSITYDVGVVFTQLN